VTNALRLRLFKPTPVEAAPEEAPEELCPCAPEEPAAEEPALPTVTIGVGGMMCSHCTAAVEKACLGVPGTVSAVASLEGKNVTVTGTADIEALKRAIIAEDYEVIG